MVEGNVHPVAKVLHTAFVHSQTRLGISIENAREETLRVARLQFEILRGHLRMLEVIAVLSPLLGLLGTVLGMIKVFRELELAGSKVDPSILSGGIWEALLTTALGLTIAIPAVLMVNYFDPGHRPGPASHGRFGHSGLYEHTAAGGDSRCEPLNLLKMQITADPKKRSLISLTPLIDVVFILLVFFMLITEFSKFSVVSLGIAQNETVSAIEQTSSIVHIASNGELRFDGRDINFSELAILAREKLGSNEKHVFFIHPEEDTLLQDTVFVLDELVVLAPDSISFLREQTRE